MNEPTGPIQAPPIYQALAASKNLSADAVLLEALGDLDEDFKVHAINVLLARQREPVMRRLLDRYHELTEPCKAYLARSIGRLEGTLRETIRSPEEHDRFSTIDLVSRSGSPAMSYLLGMALHNPMTSTRGRAALALRRMVHGFVSQTRPPAVAAIQSLRAEDHYRRFRAEADRRRLLVATLREALVAYDVHMRTSVVEAALLLCLDLEAELLAEADRPQSKCWRAILDMIRDAPGPTLAPLVLLALGHEASGPDVAGAVSACRDGSLMLALVDHAWLLGDPAIHRGCARIRKLSWLEGTPAVLFEIDEQRLGRLIRLVQATSVPEAQRVQWYRSILLSDHRDKQRLALHAIVAIKSELATDVLRVVVDWADPDLARIALRELLRRRPADAGALLERYDQPPRRTAESELVAIACASFEEYWDEFPHMSGPLRKVVGRRVMGRDPAAYDQLQSRLGSKDAADRVRAIQIVKVLGLITRYKAAVFGCARDADRVVRSAAVRALAQLQDGTSEMILSRALEDDDSRVRANAIDAMDDLGVTRQVDRIQARLRDPDHRVRAAAINALLKLQIREAAEALILLLRDPSRAHRVSALWVVEKYGLAGLLNQISDIAENDPDEGVRQRARQLVQAERRRRRQRSRGPTPAETEP